MFKPLEIVVSHRRLVKSHARLQYCIFCNDEITDPILHVWLQCCMWQSQRSAILGACGMPARLNREFLIGLLNAGPCDAGFREIVSLCAALDSGAREFWIRVA